LLYRYGRTLGVAAAVYAGAVDQVEPAERPHAGRAATQAAVARVGLLPDNRRQ